MISPRCFFSRMRRSRADAEGFVGVLCLTGRSARATRSDSLLATSSRLRSCDRCRSLDNRMLPAESMRERNAVWTFCFCRGPRARDAAMFHSRTAFVEERFACCPPGPPEGTNVKDSSSAGIVTLRLTRISTTEPYAASSSRSSSAEVTGSRHTPRLQTYAVGRPSTSSRPSNRGTLSATSRGSPTSVMEFGR